MMKQNELKRLETEFNWTAPIPNQEGVRIPNIPIGADVSFPADSYDNNELNDEGSGVWGEVRLEAIHQLMNEHGLSTLWEVGAGNGAVCIGLSSMGYETVAIEPLYGGAKYLADQGLVSFGSTLEELRLPANALPAIGIFDVLEHIEEPLPMLEEFARVLEKKGLLLITVPAHQFLFSNHDYSIGHFRRYSKKSLVSSLDEAGFELMSVRFLFAFLVPFAWILRVLPEKLGLARRANPVNKGRSQMRIANATSSIFRLVASVEGLIRLPFGLSILAVAKPKVQIKP